MHFTHQQPLQAIVKPLNEYKHITWSENKPAVDFQDQKWGLQLFLAVSLSQNLLKISKFNPFTRSW